MEWIKIKVSHVLIEYSDFAENQIGAWVLAMGLTAALEKMPTEEQLKSKIHGSTLNSLKSGLSRHGVTLEFVLSKVLDDVEYANSLKETNRSKIAKWREKKKNVTSYETSNEPDKIREDKIREDKSREKRFSPPSLKELNEFIKEKGYLVNPTTFFNHYESNGWRVGKVGMKNWHAAVTNWNTRDKDEKKSGISAPVHKETEDQKAMRIAFRKREEAKEK